MQDDLLTHRHVIGAVLAAHASVGYGVPKAMAAVPTHAAHALADFDDDAVVRFTRIAERAGLLIWTSGERYAIKVPVVEYLIGYYFAWLADARQGGTSARPQNILSEFFRRQFPLAQHSEAWQMAFDIMWRGSEEQRANASRLCKWAIHVSSVLACSVQLKSNVSHVSNDDAIPVTYCEAILSIALPAYTSPWASPADQNRRKELDDLAFGQLVKNITWAWTVDVDPAVDLERLGRCRPDRLINELLDLLLATNSKSVMQRACKTLGRLGQHMGKNKVDVLISLVAEPKYADVIFSIVIAIGEAGIHHDFIGTNSLIQYIYSGNAISLRKKIITTMGINTYSFDYEATRSLLTFLEKDEFRDIWEKSLFAIWNSLAPLDAESFRRLFSFFMNDRYDSLRKEILRAMHNGIASHLNAQHADALLARTTQPRFQPLLPDIVQILKFANRVRFNRFQIDKLWLLFANGCADTRCDVAWVLARHADKLSTGELGEVIDFYSRLCGDENGTFQSLPPEFANAIVSSLAEKSPDRLAVVEERWSRRGDTEPALGGAVSIVEPPVQVTPVLIDRVLQALSETIGRPDVKAFDATVNLIAGHGRHLLHVRARLDALAVAGRLAAVRRIIAVFPTFVLYASDAKATGHGRYRVSHAIAVEGEGTILLCVGPEATDRAVGNPESADGLPRRRLPALGKRSSDVIDAVDSMLRVHSQAIPGGVEAYSARVQALQGKRQKSERHRFFFRLMILLRRFVAADRRQRFIWKKGSGSARTLVAHSELVAKASSTYEGGDGKHTFVDAEVLNDLVLHASQDLLDAVVALADGGDAPLAESWRDFDLPAFVCWTCGAVYPVGIEAYDWKGPIPPPKDLCRICKSDLTAAPVEAIDAMQCASDSARLVLTKPLASVTWPFRRRISAEHCPCEACRNGRKKLVPVRPPTR